MTKQVLYSISNGAILDWQDTDLFTYAEPQDGFSVSAVTDAEYEQRAQWQSIEDGQLSANPVVDTANLDVLKSAKSGEITSSCLAAIDAGFTYGGDRYDSDLVSRTNIIGTAMAVQAGIPLPEGFTWRTADNENIPMDGPGAIALGAALLDHVNQNYAASWSLKAQIEAATTPEEVAAISWPTEP